MNISQKITPRDVPTQSARPSREQPASSSVDAGRPTPSDSVAISSAARVRAGRPSLSAERIHDIRQKVSAGAYDSPRIVESVARRILQRGDL